MMDYCLEDARTCRDVFKAMLPDIVAPQHGLAQALLRGRAMRACARIEHIGVPVDLELLRAFEANWPAMRRALIEATDPGRYDCFEDGVFKRRRFEALLKRLGICRWPRTETGLPSLKDRTFREQIVTYPELGDLHELYATLQQMKTFEISVGPDGRHRPAMLSPFGTDTARHNAGKARKEDKGGAFIFGLARWFRGLIKPGPGMAIVYSDYASEEISIAAGLSRDPNLLEAVRSGDPYLWFLIAIGMMPKGARREDHEELRDWVKPFLLGIHYGLTVIGAAARLKVSVGRSGPLPGDAPAAVPRVLEMVGRLCRHRLRAACDGIPVGVAPANPCRGQQAQLEEPPDPDHGQPHPALRRDRVDRERHPGLLPGP